MQRRRWTIPALGLATLIMAESIFSPKEKPLLEDSIGGTAAVLQLDGGTAEVFDNVYFQMTASDSSYHISTTKQPLEGHTQGDIVRVSLDHMRYIIVDKVEDCDYTNIEWCTPDVEMYMLYLENEDGDFMRAANIEIEDGVGAYRCISGVVEECDRGHSSLLLSANLMFGVYFRYAAGLAEEEAKNNPRIASR